MACRLNISQNAAKFSKKSCLSSQQALKEMVTFFRIRFRCAPEASICCILFVSEKAAVEHHRSHIIRGQILSHVRTIEFYDTLFQFFVRQDFLQESQISVISGKGNGAMYITRVVLHL